MTHGIEFDEAGLLAKAAKASVEVLKRMGAYVRKVARARVKISPDSAPVGDSPRSRRGNLKRGVLFGVDKEAKSVLVGPSVKHVGTSMMAHEFGGAYKKERYPKRPLMGPALRQSLPHLAKMWEDAVK